MNQGKFAGGSASSMDVLPDCRIDDRALIMRAHQPPILGRVVDLFARRQGFSVEDGHIIHPLAELRCEAR